MRRLRRLRPTSEISTSWWSDTAERPHAVWQADRTQLDLWVIASSGRPVRPWPTAVEDDHSRAVAA
ncbi:hypothetical protein [Streptomyces prunicolor]|uniref:Transposase n=1 Tax=Streptomyces prunicolor TaxID=67348 RepID=A0ABU4F3L9_9ACTN|nr:hypothetical protein [Streptomyces prunicolor]MDV7215194.1 hypothetical protein [Streptomyces prunicolor]